LRCAAEPTKKREGDAKPIAQPAAAGAEGSLATQGTQAPARPAAPSSSILTISNKDTDGGFWSSGLPGKLAVMLGLVAFSRLGVYVRLPGVDVAAFAANVQVRS